MNISLVFCVEQFYTIFCMIKKTTHNSCELTPQEIEIINTAFAELSHEMRAVAFSISDKMVSNNHEHNKNYRSKGIKIGIQDKDILLKNGVKSQADGRIYGNRRDYNDHLKRHDVVEIGDQAPIHASKEIRGDFECRKELHDAIKQHIG